MIGPLLISMGGKGVTLTIFLFLVIFFNFSILVVEIKLMIFLFLENFSFDKILFPTKGVKPKIIVEDLLIIS